VKIVFFPAREKAIVVNLEFIKAIVTAQEVLILDPRNATVTPFIDQLKEQLLISRTHDAKRNEKLDLISSKQTKEDEAFLGSDFVGSTEEELPFEFRVLEVALEVVCGFLDAKVTELEQNAYPILDELTRSVSTSNLERVRSLKSSLTRLLARVQKVGHYFCSFTC
jgi:magnesium transporter